MILEYRTSTDKLIVSLLGLPTASATINDAPHIGLLVNAGYVKVRPVVVFPNINDELSAMLRNIMSV